jgi:AcrR family transcriptional regulator
MVAKERPRLPAKSVSSRGDQIRAPLIEATITSIARDGLAGASVERITDRIGVSQGLVRHYFGSKAALLSESFQKLADDYRGMLGITPYAVQLPADIAEGRLRDAILPMFERLESGPSRQYAWFGFWALARSDVEIERLNHELYEDVVRHLGGLMADVAAAHGRAIDAEAAGSGLAAMMEGAWVHCVIGVSGISVPEAERICLDYATRLLDLDSLRA